MALYVVTFGQATPLAFGHGETSFPEEIVIVPPARDGYGH